MGEKYLELHNIMKSKYGNLHWWPAETKDQIIIGAILTQNTSWKNVEIVLNNLSIKEEDSLEAIWAMDINKLKETIKPAGFFNLKSSYLKNVSLKIIEYGGIQKVGELCDSELEIFLLSIKGIGKETMQDIMLYAFGRKIFIMDKYAGRLFSRVGIISHKKKDLQLLGKEIANNLSLDDLGNFHGEIVEISKNICCAKPECIQCFLNDMCQYAKLLAKV